MFLHKHLHKSLCWQQFLCTIHPQSVETFFRSVVDEEMLITDENMRDKCEEGLDVDEEVLVPMSIYKEKHILVPMLEINVTPSQLATTLKIYMLTPSQLATLQVSSCMAMAWQVLHAWYCQYGAWLWRAMQNLEGMHKGRQTDQRPCTVFQSSHQLAQRVFFQA